MKSQIALWKQLLVIIAIGAAGYAVWQGRDRVSQLTGISLGQGKEVAREGRGRGGGDRKVPVIVEPVKMVQAIDRIQAVGDGLANRSVTIYPEVAGIVSEIDFAAGKRVKTGDVIVKLDDAQAKIAVSLAQTKLDDARRTYERNLSLLPKNAVAQTTVDTSQTALQTAELELQQAQEALADRTVRAAFDGVLGIPQVDVGDRVSETTVITTLDDRSSILVAFDVPETYLDQLKVGQKVAATTAGLRGREFEGEIAEINSRVETATRAVRIRASLRNPEDLLRGGMSFVVVLTLEGKEYPAIPGLALQWEREGSYIWRADEAGKAEKLNVAVVKRAAGEILVDAPLRAGQLVVVEGTQRLRPGRELSFETPVAANQGPEGL
jgi:RND family efflux transporter MFP subunit